MGKKKRNKTTVVTESKNDQYSEAEYNASKMAEFTEWFAKELIKQTVYNPKNSSAKKSYAFSKYTKEQIIGWLKSPSASEKSLRDASNYLYLSSMQYQRLISYYAGLHTGAYVITPLGFDGTVSEKTFLKQYHKVCKAIELINIPKFIKYIITIVLRDGVFYGVRWGDKASSFIQRIDPSYCKIAYVCNGSFLYSIDVTKIQNALEYYPPEFSALYTNYLTTGEKWQLVPDEISVCVKADETMPDYSIPPFAAVMPSLYTIENTEALKETAAELKNYKMIAGEVATDGRGVPVMGWDIYKKYYSQLLNAVGENVGLAVSPFKLSSFNLDDKSGAREVNEISEAVGNFWATAGTSGLLHGMSNDTAGVTKLAIKNDETYVFNIVSQIESTINRYLRTSFSTSAKFKITILPISVFNQSEKIQEYKEAASFGLGKSYYAAAIGIPQTDVSGLNYLEKETKMFDDLVPMKNTYNTGVSGDAGRPEEDVEDLSPEGEATRDNGTNDNR